MITDKNNVPEMLRKIEQLKGNKIQVGVIAPEGSEMYIIAMVNEYGTSIEVTPKMRAYLHYNGLHLNADTTHIVIPERSFIRAGFDSAKDDIIKVFKKTFPALLMKQKLQVTQFYEILGEFAAGEIHNFIADLREPPNHPYTVEKKRSDHPLINNGHLNQSIAPQVVKK